MVYNFPASCFCYPKIYLVDYLVLLSEESRRLSIGLSPFLSPKSPSLPPQQTRQSEFYFLFDNVLNTGFYCKTKIYLGYDIYVDKDKRYLIARSKEHKFTPSLLFETQRHSKSMALRTFLGPMYNGVV